MVLAVATFLVFAGFTPIIPTSNVVLTLFAGDGVVVVTLIILIAAELVRLRAARRAARAGARLHSRFVALFSLVAAIPALVTATVASVSVEWAINPRFMSDVAAFINESNEAAQLYRETQCRALLRDVELSAGDLAQSSPLLRSNHELFQGYLNSRAKTLGFTAAVLMKSDGSVVESADGSDTRLVARPDKSDFDDATAKQPFCGLVGDSTAFVGIRPVQGLPDTFFYAARGIDPLTAKVAQDASDVSATFSRFESHRRNLELGFATVFVLLALTMLFSAIWLGLTFANRLVGPIRRLIRATDEVASGNLNVQVPARSSDGDLGHLSDTFNKMTLELLRQQNGLIAANALNDERRAFIEAVLSGVPAGVLGVDRDDVVTVVNAAAERLLAGGGGSASLLGRQLHDVDPGIARILEQARAMRLRLHQGQATIAARWPRAHLQRARHRRSAARRSGERDHARRHQRARHRAAHGRLGGRRAPHRARDQEPADADPALRRTAQAPLRPQYRRGQGSLRSMHRHDHPAGRRHQAHGRRVLVLRAHAEGAAGQRRSHRLRAPGAVPDAGRSRRTSPSRTTCRTSR